ncbi:MAG: Rrf2 family transcriptional regulator [Nitrospinae bacterium]|nr:Rrf2 family transcriptional regulator [Nitrospinota bacterium]
MKFSAKFEYALLALLYLKCEPDEAPVSGRILSEKLKIPYRFLEQILSDLKKAGLVRSVRGYQGGYALNLGPEEISLYDIYQVTEGRIEPWDCGISVSAKCGQDHNLCVINQFYSDFKNTFKDLLKSYTLLRLCVQTHTLKTEAGLVKRTPALPVG